SKVLLALFGVALSTALCGCMSSGTVTPASGFAETASMCEADAGYQLSLPDTVAVVPEPSGRAAGPALDGRLVGAAAAFAGHSPGAAGSILAATTASAGQPFTEMLVVEARDPSRVFPDATSLPESDGTLFA